MIRAEWLEYLNHTPFLSLIFLNLLTEMISSPIFYQILPRRMIV